jgi:hypothetical protein
MFRSNNMKILSDSFCSLCRESGVIYRIAFVMLKLIEGHKK